VCLFQPSSYPGSAGKTVWLRALSNKHEYLTHSTFSEAVSRSTKRSLLRRPTPTFVKKSSFDQIQTYIWNDKNERALRKAVLQSANFIQNVLSKYLLFEDVMKGVT
jgi:hypothetical protein